MLPRNNIKRTSDTFPKMQDSLFYITVSTRPHRVLNALQKKVQDQNETLLVFGQEENRAIGWESHQNFGLKLKYVSEFLKQSTVQPYDFVLFTDAYDVAYYGTKSDIIERFLSFKKPIVFGSERFCNPDPHLEKEYKLRDVDFPFLNSGMFIGYAWALNQFIGKYQYNDVDDDQRFWTRQFLNNPDFFALDYENQLFLNTAGINETDISILTKKGRKEINYRGKQPLFVHVNGPDKKFIDSLL